MSAGWWVDRAAVVRLGTREAERNNEESSYGKDWHKIRVNSHVSPTVVQIPAASFANRNHCT